METDGADFDTISEKLDIFMSVIVKCVNGADLVPYMTDIVEEGDRKKIRNIARNESPCSATKYLLEVIAKEKDDKRKWRSFITALEEAEYPFVANVLEGDTAYRISHENQAKIIECLTPVISKLILPREIVPHILAKNIITKQDAEEMSAQEVNYGPFAGAMILLDKIPRRVDDWYELFLQVLFECEDGRYRHLARMIDEDFVNKKERQMQVLNAEDTTTQTDVKKLETMEDEDKDTQTETKPLKVEVAEDDQATMEHYMSESGPAYNKDNDLNSPSSVNEENMIYSMASGIIEKMKSDNVEYNEPTKTAVTDDISNQTKLKLKIEETAADPNLNSKLTTKETRKELPPVEVLDSLDNNTQDEEMQSIMEASDVKKIAEKVTKTFTLAFNMKTPLEPNITGNEGSQENVDVDSDEDSEITKENFELRGYQTELAKPGIEGKNTIVIAPTGSGKTHVAMGILKNHFEELKGRRIAKVILIANNSALAHQHRDMCQTFLDYSVKCITGETQRPEKIKSLAKWIDKRDILIVTAQIWLNSILQRDTNINSFTLVIFDECHHCTLKHAYNKIMEFYMDIKHGDNNGNVRLPQIIGLTASVGIGKANDIDTAKEKIIELMSNLDVHMVATVRSEASRQELSEYVKLPFEETRTIRGRAKNIMGELIEGMMENLEKSIKSSPYIKHFETKASKDKILKIPVQRGGDQYTQWIGETFRDISKLDDKHAHQFFIVCRKYLDILNRALIIYRDARTVDAYDFIGKSIGEKKPTGKQHEIDNIMLKWVEEVQPVFEYSLTDRNHENPKLKELERIVCDVYNANNDMRAIVFVKTKDLGVAIVKWMNDSKILKQLNPVTFFGVQASSERGGLTKNEQSSVLTKFRDGEVKLIVATTVAEEGLDISKCNLVIRYDHVTNVIGMVQSRGRARASDSSNVTIAQQGQGTAERQELNLMRENLMNNAIFELQDEINQNQLQFIQSLMKLQEGSKVIRDAESLYREGRHIAEGAFVLQCGHCSQFLCMSVDIRKILLSHHVVICPDIVNYVQITPTLSSTYQESNFQFCVDKLHCKRCGNPVGNISLYEKIPFPVLAIKNLRFQDEEGKYSKVPKKWKDAPFTPEDLSTDDLKKLILAHKQLYKT